ncbi:hypothetical protein Gpo141_00001520 [Globisporangium polare]
MGTTLQRSLRGYRRACSFALLLSALLVVLQTTHVHGEDLAIEEFQQHHSRGMLDQGCRACRGGGNCSIAVENALPGVFCGDLVMTLQPCCCSFRNECMTTIFSESCECFNSEEEEELMTTRFYLFIVLTLIAWVLLIYDKMCGAPYKVMNSSHVLLANSPSAARSVAGSDSEDDDQQQQQQIQEEDDGAQVELTVLSSPRAAGNTSNSSSSDNANSGGAETSTAPAGASTRTMAADDLVAPSATLNASDDHASIPSV